MDHKKFAKYTIHQFLSILFIVIFLLVPNLKFSLEKSSFDNFNIKLLLFGPNTPRHAISSVTSLNSTSLDKCFKMWNLSCSLFAAEVTILK